MAPLTRAARMAEASEAARQGAEDAVPGPRADGPGDGWAALDHLSVWDCYLCHVPLAKDVNRLFHSDWALAFGEVLDQVHIALEDPDPLVLERALKWALVCHQLLLRLDIAPSGTRRGQRYLASVRHRFTLFQQGGSSMRVLVALWRADVATALARSGSRPLNTEASVRHAVRLIEDMCVAKAMPYLEGSGLGDLQLREIRQQLRRKHPQDRIEWPAGLVQRSPRLKLSDARNVLKALARNAGCGADRFRNEYLIRLVRGEMADSVRSQALEAWGNFADHVSNADFPPWFYTVWTTVVQFAPINWVPAEVPWPSCTGSH